MKKFLVTVLFIAISAASFGQDNSPASAVDVNKEAVIKQATTKTSKLKTKVINLNHKKSIDLISIRAYRKSLQIKVKTVKLC